MNADKPDPNLVPQIMGENIQDENSGSKEIQITNKGVIHMEQQDFGKSDINNINNKNSTIIEFKK